MSSGTSKHCRRLVGVVAVCVLFLTVSTWCAAETGEFEVVYQNDGLMGMVDRKMPHFPRWQTVDDITDPAYFKAEVDAYADCGVKSISWGLWSGGNSFNHPTKVGRLWCQGIPDEVITHKIHLQIKHDLAACAAKGVDPLDVIVKRANERGLTITAEMRANNFCPGGTLEKPSYAGPGYNGLLWYEKPEWRLTDTYADPNWKQDPNPNWDWSNPEVRQFNLRVLFEVLHNYDVDGMDLNVGQNPPYFDRAEPNKAQHMTAFVKALRDECDRVGKERGKHIMLTIIMWDSLWGRHHLRDDGIDIANWIKQGWIDRVAVRYGDKAKYLAMVKGTKCKLYAAIEPDKRKHADFAKIEKEYRDAGYDGVFVFNYMIGPGKRDEFRSQDASYRADVLPTVAPNIWEQAGEGSAEVIEGRLELKGGVSFQRGADRLTMGGPGVTVEAQVHGVRATSPGICGIRIADGQRAVTFGISGDKLILMEGDAQGEVVGIDPAKAHTLRLTIDRKHLAKAYLDGKNQPVLTATLTKRVADRAITWGHLQVNGKTESRSRWEAVHYTLDGAFGPGEHSFK